ncbi:outer membrane protein assembly factor BamB family protein [Gimesia fumaroli]|uniref:Serine/threonine-protein kinase AfsK n=1 Tax=Gimesia fumaroli TaxID=2527976 RepID=A0A518IH92_9PLAN|nr:PQQ-binding-like beta-propeller repeat protein [Gimesia fumaroli]QDV52466.1 Serine/threonine-protein kinase AfsK [Gimesia fumaroli]
MRVLKHREFAHRYLSFFSVLLAGICLLIPLPAAEKPDTQPTLAASKLESNKQNWFSFRNGNLQQGVSKTTLPDELELLWEHPSSDGIASTAAIVGDHVYMAGLNGYVECLDLKTGRSVWKYRSIENPDPKEFAPGFKSSPLVTEKGVYLGDEDGIFHAIDRKTGKKLWTFQTDAEIISSANVVNGKLLFGGYDNNLYCLHEADGSLAWKFMTDGYVNCSPAIVDNFTFVTGCDEQLRVIDINTGKQHSQMPLETYLIASPALVGDNLYVGTYASEIISVNWKKQKVEWRYKDPKKEFPYHSSAAVTDEYVVAGGRDKQIHCVERKTGKGVWKFGTRGRVDSSPVILGNRVFVGSSDGNLYELDLKTGKTLWKKNLGKDITASPAIGSGHLIIGTESRNGALYCFGKK